MSMKTRTQQTTLNFIIGNASEEREKKKKEVFAPVTLMLSSRLDKKPGISTTKSRALPFCSSHHCSREAITENDNNNKKKN